MTTTQTTSDSKFAIEQMRKLQLDKFVPKIQYHCSVQQKDSGKYCPSDAEVGFSGFGLCPTHYAAAKEIQMHAPDGDGDDGATELPRGYSPSLFRAATASYWKCTVQVGGKGCGETGIAAHNYEGVCAEHWHKLAPGVPAPVAIDMLAELTGAPVAPVAYVAKLPNGSMASSHSPISVLQGRECFVRLAGGRWTSITKLRGAANKRWPAATDEEREGGLAYARWQLNELAGEAFEPVLEWRLSRMVGGKWFVPEDRSQSAMPIALGSALCKPVTQKAKGLRRINVFGGNISFGSNLAGSAFLWPRPSNAAVAKYDDTPDFPLFARPCPLRPRHGFVESRLVKSWSEFWDLVLELREIGEPDAEIILMPFQDADYGIVLSDGGLTVASGHDGATAGRQAITIPGNNEGLCHAIGLGENSYSGIEFGDGTYLEFVTLTGERPELVQVRAGPKAALKTSWVPKETLVKGVVTAEGDLLDWEKQVAKMEPGIVVWHPGGSLSSHYAVHCIAKGIPITCAKESPVAGQTLKEEGLAPPSRHDMWLLSQSIRSYLNEPKGAAVDVADWCHVAAATLHSQALWGWEPHLIRLRAAAMAGAVMLSAVAVVGENRHWGSRHIQKSNKRWLVGPSPGDRDIIYREAFDIPLPKLAKAVAAAKKDFEMGGWPSRVGGQAWANCAIETLKLHKAVSSFLDNPSVERWANCVVALNGVIHMSHNNGTFLNKFMPAILFNKYSANPSIGMLRPLAMRLTIGNWAGGTLSKVDAQAWSRACAVSRVKEPVDISSYLGLNNTDESESSDSDEDDEDDEE